MSDRALRRLAVGVAVASIAIAVAGDILGAARGSSVKNVAQQTLQDIFNSSAFLVLPVIAAVIARREPRNAIVWLLCVMGLSTLVGNLSLEYAVLALLIHPSALPLGQVAAWTAWWVWAPGILLPPVALLIFPNGRPLSPRWRWVVVIDLGLVVLASVGLAFLPSSAAWTSGPIPFSNPLGQHFVGRFAQPLFLLLGPAAAVLALCGLVSTILRYRRSNQEGRHQLKWFLFAAAMMPLSIASGIVTPNTFIPQPLTPVLVAGMLLNDLAIVAGPVAIAIAILKYRLYDIDVVISRTLVYGALAAFITGIYVAIVVGIGSLIGSGGKPNLGLSIIATAVVAVGFQPVRERLQKVANRLVYGKRATPYEVLSEFSGQVAETYSADDVLPRMARVLAEGTGAEVATVWLRSGDQLRPAAAYPHETNGTAPVELVGQILPEIAASDRAVPVRHQGELLGALSVKKRQAESLTPIEEKLLDDLAHQAGLVLKNVGLTADLQTRLEELRLSRQRLVKAQDDERRKLERNLHDGAQQHLVALKVKLGLAEALTAKDPTRAKATIQQLKRDADEALETLRDLARGIYPPLLADKGLQAALESQARKATVPVAVEAEGVGRYSQEIEAAVYFCCLEALQNVQKYAEAGGTTVRLSSRDGELTFEIQDDGQGFDPTTIKGGTGLTNMADRLDALGGGVDVHSEPGRGTLLRGRVPFLLGVG
jgi:signal transduction histidine kinase